MAKRFGGGQSAKGGVARLPRIAIALLHVDTLGSVASGAMPARLTAAPVGLPESPSKSLGDYSAAPSLVV